MIGLNFQDILEKIKSSKGLSDEDIQRKVDEKKSSLGGLVSDEGAIHIVANELGIDVMAEIRKRGVKIERLQPGMRVGLVGKVVKVYDVRSFDKNGRSGKVANFLIGDETGMLRIVLWDEKHIAEMENGSIKEGTIVKIGNGNVRENNGYKEMHLGGYSELELNPEGVEVEVKEQENGFMQQPSYSKKKINDLQDGDVASVFGTVVQVFEPRFYEGCSDCFRKAVDGKCVQHESANVIKIPILNFYVDDGMGGIRATAFRDLVPTLLKVSNEEVLSLEGDADKFNEVKNNILGQQLQLSGKATMNSMSNRLEFSIRSASPVSPEDLLKESMA